MSYPFTPPPFLLNQAVDDIHQRMMAALPDDIDKSELQIPWDYTRPAAIEKAEFVEFELAETIKLIFPHWAYAEWLDLHAEMEGLARRMANKSSGYLTVKGNPGLVVAEGFQFATPANLTPSVIFEATEDVTLDNGSYILRDTANPSTNVVMLSLNNPSGNRRITLTLRPTQENPENTSELIIRDGDTVLESYTFDTPTGADHADMLIEAVEIAGGSELFSLSKLAASTMPLLEIDSAMIGTTIPIRAIEGGSSGNVPPDSIILTVRPDTGITFVTNAQAVTGGTQTEDDDTLRERILEVKRYGISFTGCDADYSRWGREVPGTGSVVVDPEWDDPQLSESFLWIDSAGNRRKAGAVRIFIIDANGLPANQQILDAVYDHIIRPNNRMERLAPIGATLTVASPAPIYIDITATVTIADGEDIDTVTMRFKENLDRYWLRATTEHDIYDVQSGIVQNYVKYVFVGATLADTAGIVNYDHNTLLVNGATSDILVELGTFPVTREVILIE